MTTIVTAFIILFLFELLYFRLADRWNIVDKPNERSSHSCVTLRGGGIVFPVAGLLYFFIGGFSYPLFIFGLVLISAISFWDDIKPLPNKIRLAVHFTALLLLFQQWELFQQHPWFVVPALIFCAGIINAWNFMDGINGITGGYGLVVLGSLAIVNRFDESFVDPMLLEIILTSLLVFCFFNFRTKAKCFAGDVGSVSIAFVVTFVLGTLVLKTKDLTWLSLIAVYGVDSVLTIIHRIVIGENIFKPHRKHVYQLLANEQGIPHVRVSLIYMALQSLVVVGLLSCECLGPIGRWTYFIVVLLLLCLVYMLIKRRLFHLHRINT